MGATSYNNRPASGKKLQSNKQLPPKNPIPNVVQKKQYNIQDNMTQSRIHEAKQGLQLLKKKMSSKGLSKEKIASNQQMNSEKVVGSLKSMASNKNQQTQYYENRNSNMPPKKLQKKSTIQQPSHKPPNQSKPASTRTINDNISNNSKPTPQNDRKKPGPPAPKYEQYHDENMQAPIKPKKDFNALLEEELRKEKQGMGGGSKPVVNKKMDQYPSQNDMELIQCSYCERKFGEAAIEKHQKICLKVFQTKRKAFDSAAHRAPEVQGFQQIKAKSKKDDPPPKQQPQPSKKPNSNSIPAKKQQQIPKWKAASLAFRANLKQAKGVQLTNQEKKASETAQGLVQCNYCGRKFNQKAATRHIPFCETKSKQLPRTNTGGKKR